MSQASRRLPCRVDGFIPHTNSMLLVDELTAVEGAAGTVVAEIRSDSVFVDEYGLFEPAAFIELVAQGFAAVKGWDYLHRGMPMTLGYLVAVREISIYEQARVGDRLIIHVKVVGGIGGFVVVQGDVQRDETLLASGSLKVYIDDDSKK